MADLVKCPFCGKEIESDSYYCDQCGEELKCCPAGHGFKKGKICGTCGQPLVLAKDVAGGGASTGNAPASSGMGSGAQPTSPNGSYVGQPGGMQPSQGGSYAGQSAPNTAQGYANNPSGGNQYSQAGSQQTSGQPFNNPSSYNTTPGVSPQATVPPVQPAADRTVRPGPPVAEPTSLMSARLGVAIALRDGAVIGRRTGDYIHVFASQGYVSGTHARLQRNGAGQWEVVDLDSTNGTFVNGNRIPPHQPVPIKIGDKVAFYDSDFVVE